ncbi:hypothetical protein LTR08_009091 [Meristemomyces frigidus]|nr:hypothetical protein LTR08_009091 [Meristemomyces frigidus]
MADAALDSFMALLESVPKWIADLEAILKATNTRQHESVLENQPASPPALANKPSKSSSLRSRCSAVLKVQTETAATPGTSQATLLRPQLPHKASSDAPRLSQRKRKTASACSGDRSGPSKFRSRSMVVTYYDGDVQKRFERVVRAIGSCRNAVRKGKMGAKFDSLSRSGSNSSEASSSSGGKDVIVDFGKLGYRSIGPRQTECGVFGRHDNTEVFDKVDNLLEKGQSLCERAAHRVLRDGDCALELTHANEHIAEVQSLAKAEVPVLQKRAEKAAERRRKSAETQRADADAEQKRYLDVLDTQEIVASFVPTDGALEVDDGSDDEEPDFAVNTLQLGKYRMRSSRILAR